MDRAFHAVARRLAHCAREDLATVASRAAGTGERNEWHGAEGTRGQSGFPGHPPRTGLRLGHAWPARLISDRPDLGSVAPIGPGAHRTSQRRRSVHRWPWPYRRAPGTRRLPPAHIHPPGPPGRPRPTRIRRRTCPSHGARDGRRRCNGASLKCNRHLAHVPDGLEDGALARRTNGMTRTKCWRNMQEMTPGRRP